MSLAAVAIGGTTLAGAYMNSKAAGDAADAQTAAANQSNATQRYMYDQTRQDNAPFLSNGVAGNNQLAYRLGLNTSPTGHVAEQITANDLVDTSQGDWKPNAELYANSAEYRKAWDDFYSGHQSQYGVAPNLSRGSDLQAVQSFLSDKFGLDAYNDSHRQQAQQAETSDPQYGSLLRKFTLDDLNNDPVYKTGLQFGLDEGNKGIERQAAASGSMLSGATLKALAKYATDYAGTKANESYNRFNNDQTNTYNRLAGVSGAGQQANALVGSAGMNTANNISANQVGIGNARGAAAIGSANAWSGALSNGINTYQQNQLLNKLTPQSGQWWNSAEGINANGGGF